MMYEEFNRIAGKVCALEMFDEVERVYMAFEAITKKELAVIYWGDHPTSYGLWQKALALVDRMSEGFKSDIEVNRWIEEKQRLISGIKALKVA